MKKHFFYLAPDAEALFVANGVADFEALWNAEITLVDQPNREGGGWSEVGILELASGDGNYRRFYLKRQYNYSSRLVEKPLQTIPKALREWRNIQALDRAAIPTMSVACAARNGISGSDRALFATCALEEYRDLSEWWPGDTLEDEKTSVLQSLGRLIARLHNAGYNHGCLYPKHIYISDTNTSDIRLIDLEKCKRIFSKRGALRDLDSLLRRGTFWSDKHKACLLATYREKSSASWTESSLHRAVLGRIEAGAEKP